MIFRVGSLPKKFLMLMCLLTMAAFLYGFLFYEEYVIMSASEVDDSERVKVDVNEQLGVTSKTVVEDEETEIAQAEKSQTLEEPLQMEYQHTGALEEQKSQPEYQKTQALEEESQPEYQETQAYEEQKSQEIDDQKPLTSEDFGQQVPTEKQTPQGPEGQQATSEDDVRTPELETMRKCSQEERFNFIKDQCRSKELFKLPEKERKGFFVYDKYKLVYCPVYKSGTVTFRKQLVRLASGNKSATVDDFPDGVHRLVDLPEDRQQQVMREYKKMMVVRHPFDRLRSAFDDKLSKTDKWNYITLDKIIRFVHDLMQKSNKYVDEPFDPYKNTLTFNEFLTLVSQNYTHGFHDGHWETIVENCRPCQIDYDFIMRMETLSEDLPPFLDYLREVSNSTVDEFEHCNNGKRNFSQEDRKLELIQRYSNYSQEFMDNLYDVYRKDFTLFGYGWHRQNGESCKMNSCC